MKKITTDKETYIKKVETGTWKPNGKPEWDKNYAGKVKAKIPLKGKDENGDKRFEEVEIIIKGFFFTPFSGQR